MDSEKRANWPLFVAIIMGIPGWIVVVLMLWFRWYPDPAREPDVMGRAGALLTGWLPVVVVSATSALSAVALLVTGFRRWKNKSLVAEKLELEKEIGIARKNAREAVEDAKEARREKTQAEGSLHAVEADREEVRSRLANANSQVADLAWLKQLAEEQAKDISEHVVVLSRPPGSLILNRGPRVITIGLKIRNESVFDITIDPKEVKGRLFFNGTPLHELASQLIDETREAITNLKPGHTNMFVIKQPLLKSESETIADCETGQAPFWLGNLQIPISVTGNFVVATRPLRIHNEVENVRLKDFGNTNTA